MLHFIFLDNYIKLIYNYQTGGFYKNMKKFIKSLIKYKILFLLILLVVAIVLLLNSYNHFYNITNNLSLKDEKIKKAPIQKPKRYKLATDFGNISFGKSNSNGIKNTLTTEFKKLNIALGEIYKTLDLESKTLSTSSINTSSNILLDNIYHVQVMLYSDNNSSNILKSIDVYYAKKTDEILSAKSILRHNYKNIASLKHKDLNFNDIDLSTFVIEEKSITFGKKPKLLNITYENNRDLFKANIGIPSIYGGNIIEPKKIPLEKNKKYIAFTFDDGPLNNFHDKIREVFNKNNSLATFFFVGNNIKLHPDKVIKTYNDGHLIANHSMTHANLATCSPTQEETEIIGTDNLILSSTGYDSIFFRPPYGIYTKQTSTITNASIALWDIDSLDWKSRNKQKIIDTVLPKIRSKKNSIVLFHDLYETSYQAIEYLVPLLIKEGYQFIRLDDMYKIRLKK